MSQARAVSTDRLRPTFYAINSVIYSIQVILILHPGLGDLVCLFFLYYSRSVVERELQIEVGTNKIAIMVLYFRYSSTLRSCFIELVSHKLSPKLPIKQMMRE